MRKSTLSLLMLLLAVLPSLAIDDVLTKGDLIGTNSNYTDFSSISVNENSSSAKYSGRCAGGNSSIQLTKSSDATKGYYVGIYTTKSGGYVSKVAVNWNENTVTTSTRTISVYGKNTAYEAADMYSDDDDTRGTLLGTITYLKDTEIEIANGPKYICLVANNPLYANSITISWQAQPVKVLELAYAKSSYNAVLIDDVASDFETPVLSASADGEDVNLSDLTLTYSSSNPDVAEVNESTGEVKVKRVGETTITAQFAENEKYFAASASYTLIVSNPSVTFDFVNNTYEQTDNSEKNFGDDNTVKINIKKQSGNGVKFFTSSTTNSQDLRIYKTCELTFSSIKYEIAKVTFVVSDNSGKTVSLNEGQPGELDGFVWTGKSNEVKFTAGPLYLSQMIVEYATPRKAAVIKFENEQVTVDVNSEVPIPSLTEDSSKGVELSYEIADADKEYIEITDGVIKGLKATDTPVTVTAVYAESDDYLSASATFTVIVKEEAKCATPTFDTAADATLFPNKDVVKLLCLTEKASLKYQLQKEEGGELEEVCDYNEVSGIVFTEDGKWTVTAWAVKEGLEDSEKVVRTFNVVFVTENIKAWCEKASDANVTCAISGEVVVTVVNGQDMFVQDASGAIQISGANGDFVDYQVGDHITGLSATYSKYAGVVKMSDIRYVSKVEGKNLSPKTISLGQIADNDHGQYVKVFGVTATATETGTKFTLTDNNGEKVTLWNRYNNKSNYDYIVQMPTTDGVLYDIVGVVYQENSTSVVLVPTEDPAVTTRWASTGVVFTTQDVEESFGGKTIGDTFTITAKDGSGSVGMVDGTPALVLSANSALTIASQGKTKAIFGFKLTAIGEGGFGSAPALNDIVREETNSTIEDHNGTLSVSENTLTWMASSGDLANSISLNLENVNISNVEIYWAWVYPKLVDYEIEDRKMILTLKRGHHLFYQYKPAYAGKAAVRAARTEETDETTENADNADNETSDAEWIEVKDGNTGEQYNWTIETEGDNVYYIYDNEDLNEGDIILGKIVNGPLTFDKIDWKVSAAGITTSVGDVIISPVQAEGSVQYYDLQGRRVSSSRLTRGLYIKVSDGHAEKVLVR